MSRLAEPVLGRSSSSSGATSACLSPPSLLFPRVRVSEPGSLRGLPAADLRPFSDESERVFLARRVFAVCRVSTSPHHQLLLPGSKTVLQTGLPTVRHPSPFAPHACPPGRSCHLLAGPYAPAGPYTGQRGRNMLSRAQGPREPLAQFCCLVGKRQKVFKRKSEKAPNRCGDQRAPSQEPRARTPERFVTGSKGQARNVRGVFTSHGKEVKYSAAHLAKGVCTGWLYK